MFFLCDRREVVLEEAGVEAFNFIFVSSFLIAGGSDPM